MLFFSDDAVISFTIDGVKTVYNVDFSSNDATKFWALRDLLLELQNCPPDISRAIRLQSRLPLRYVSLYQKTNRDEVVLAASRYGFLMSGSGDTTNTNNMTQVCCAFLHRDSNYRNELDVVLAYEQIGHKVTLERCELIEDMQFLKMSLVRHHDGWTCALNPGVILRASGCCKGDLPGRGSLSIRAAEFQTALIRGLTSYVNNETLMSLSPNVGSASIDLSEYYGGVHVITADTRPPRVEDHDLFRRYRLTSLQIEELKYACTNTAVGINAWSPAAGIILQKDYGIAVPLA